MAIQGKSDQKNITTDGENFDEKVLYINRVAKVVKGGRRFSFSAIVVVGNQAGKVGVGLGKANEVPEAIKKASKNAKKNAVEIPLTGEARTVPHEVIGKFGAGRVMLKPADEGTGIIASGTVRGILEAAGIQNIRTKILRSRNPHNVVKATIAGLLEMRSFDEIAKTRGKELAEIL